MLVRLIALTKPTNSLLNHQDFIPFIARVSSPSNQYNTETGPKLIKYLIKHNHWSPFEHCYMTLEITTSRAVASQLLRHRSFVFQEFSQRYSEVEGFMPVRPRRQDLANRQNSLDDISDIIRDKFQRDLSSIQIKALQYYKEALMLGVAKESARFLLPLNTKTTLFMTGNMRSWIHYIKVRTDKSTQLEHRIIAEKCKEIIQEQFSYIEI